MSLIEPSATRGTHRTFSPSSPAFINYTDEQFINALRNKTRSQIGTEIHLWAAVQITLGQKCSSLRDMAKSIKTLIFLNNFSDRYGLSEIGKKVLKNIKYLPTDVYGTVKIYVNDCITDRMEPEKELILSDDIGGTCDAIGYDSVKKVLRVYDLKTGTGKAHIEQCIAYAALYCIINEVNPFGITTILRIYQNGEIEEFLPNPDDMLAVIDNIQHLDKIAFTAQKGDTI